MPTLFSDYTELPRLTEQGFKVIKCPIHLFNAAKEIHSLIAHKQELEHEDEEHHVISGRSDITSFDHVPNLRFLLHKQFQPWLESWSQEPLQVAYMYGIRTYNQGATLDVHRDRRETHHISAIIIFDKDLATGQDWPLDIQAHDGQWHKIYADVGDMILYESAVCKHGRIEEFTGKTFSNFYVHFKLRNWKYNPK
jgi:hypothetical protein